MRGAGQLPWPWGEVTGAPAGETRGSGQVGGAGCTDGKPSACLQGCRKAARFFIPLCGTTENELSGVAQSQYVLVLVEPTGNSQGVQGNGCPSAGVQVGRFGFHVRVTGSWTSDGDT